MSACSCGSTCPAPQDVRAAVPRPARERIPAVDADDGRVRVKVISGQSHGVDSVKDLACTPVWILDVEIQPGGRAAQPLPRGWSAFAYTLEGQALFGPAGNQTPVDQYHNVVFEHEGDVVHAAVDPGAASAARFVLIRSCAAARPAGRPVRPVRAQLQGGGLPGPNRLPAAPERLRAGRRLAERDWKVHGPLSSGFAVVLYVRVTSCRHLEACTCRCVVVCRGLLLLADK